MNYQPNYADPRVSKRIKKAIGFSAVFLSDTPRGWSTRYIDNYLGRNETDLGKWLRTKLLICTNERYSKDSGVCKQYIKNTAGVNEVAALLKSNDSYPSVQQVGDMPTICVQQVALDLINEEYKDELASKDFKYDDKSSRLWHSLQHARKEYKQTIFPQHGLKFQYDIECCAPTLIHQYSQQVPEVIEEGKWKQGPMDLYLFALRRYLKDRKQIRQDLADQTEISYKDAKVIINALLMGAQLGNNKEIKPALNFLKRTTT
jgi:hypothetical protein